MTRSELIASLRQRFPQLALKDAELSVAEILGALGSAISRGSRVEIRGFGSFCLNYRSPRLGRNPRTGEPVNIPEKWTPHFKPGKELRELVNAE
jgi:integration host factor subunit beta